jgi:hypothetical protein
LGYPGAFVNTSGDFGKYFIGKCEQVGNPVIAEVIIDVATLLDRGHEAAVSETCQVIGGVRLGEIGHGHNFGHIPGAIEQAFEDR